MALLVIALAGVIMASTARRSCLEAVRANTALEDLRRRWGAIGLQRALVGQCEQMILAAEAEGDADRQGPVTRVERRLALTGMTWRLVVGDEQAKVNVNTISTRGGTPALTAALTELLGVEAADLAVALRPALPEQPHGKRVRPYGSLGQVFAGDWAGAVLRSRPDDPAAIERITCWGDGRINFRRASPEALRAATAGVLDDTQRWKLLELREDIPGISLSEALKRLDLARKQRSRAAAVLADRSRCHSLWIVAETGRRSWRRLVVVESGGRKQGSSPIAGVFVW
jgi:hypothetical protein